MKYYFLDGLEKKGPYTSNEIISRNLSCETLIFREDKSNWLPLSDFEELNLKSEIKNGTANSNVLKDKYKLFKECLFYYILLCVFLALIRTLFVVVSFENNKNDSNRYPWVFNGQIESTEEMYGNQQEFLFRGVKPQTIYLTNDEQNSYFILFFNILFSNIISLSVLFIIFYIYVLKKNIDLNNSKYLIKIFKISLIVLVLLGLILVS